MPAESHGGDRRRPVRAILGWVLATLLVAIAVVGPPLTGQSVHALVALRHDILTIDREFERSSLRADNAPSAIRPGVPDRFKLGSAIVAATMPNRGGAA